MEKYETLERHFQYFTRQSAIITLSLNAWDHLGYFQFIWKHSVSQRMLKRSNNAAKVVSYNIKVYFIVTNTFLLYQGKKG